MEYQEVIDWHSFEVILVVLYKLGEFDACKCLLDAAERQFGNGEMYEVIRL